MNILGDPKVVMYLDDDGLQQQKYASCNSCGSQKVFPCVCLEPLSASVVVPDGGSWVSPVIEVPDGRWDIDYYIKNVAGSDIVLQLIMYIPNLDVPDINETINIPDVIGAGEVFAYHGYNLRNRAIAVTGMDDHVWAHRGIRVTITADAGADAQVVPMLKLTPRL